MNNQPSTKQVNTAKIGLFSSITILISAVVGIGIFFKNKSVLANNDYNGWGVLISWIVASLITLTTALAFAEIISASKKHDGSGLAGWALKFCGHRIGRFILIVMPLFYFLFKLVDTSFFCGESILLIFNNESSTSGARIIAQDTYVIVLIAFAIMLIFIAINAFSTRAAKTISSIASIAKFLPLIVVGILGIVFGALDGFQHTFFHTSLSSGLTDDPTIIGNINVLGIFASLPALLFTFDSFLTIGNAASSMRNPEKDVPKAILIGIPVIVFLYLFVTIGQLLTGQKDVYSFFSYVVTQSGGSQNALVATNIIIGCVIMISLLGSVNAFTLTAIRSMQSAINDEILIGSVALKRITNGRALKGGALMAVVLGTIASGLMAIPIIIQNKDAAYDGVSNLPTLFFFIIYAIIILFGLINHFTNKIAVKKIKLFPVIACIAIIGCAFAFGYNLFYEYFGRCFADNKDVSWGMFKGESINRPIASGLVWAVFGVFLLIPFINDLCIKLFRKNHNQRLLWM